MGIDLLSGPCYGLNVCPPQIHTLKPYLTSDMTFGGHPSLLSSLPLPSCQTLSSQEGRAHPWLTPVDPRAQHGTGTQNLEGGITMHMTSVFQACLEVLAHPQAQHG